MFITMFADFFFNNNKDMWTESIKGKCMNEGQTHNKLLFIQDEPERGFVKAGKPWIKRELKYDHIHRW